MLYHLFQGYNKKYTLLSIDSILFQFHSHLPWNLINYKYISAAVCVISHSFPLFTSLLPLSSLIPNVETRQRRNNIAEKTRRNFIVAKNNMQWNIAQREKKLFADRKSPLASANCRKQEKKKAFQIVMQFDNEIWLSSVSLHPSRLFRCWKNIFQCPLFASLSFYIANKSESINGDFFIHQNPSPTRIFRIKSIIIKKNFKFSCNLHILNQKKLCRHNPSTIYFIDFS